MGLKRFKVDAMKQKEGSKWKFRVMITTMLRKARKKVKHAFWRMLSFGLTNVVGCHAASFILTASASLGLNSSVAGILCVTFTELVAYFYHVRRHCPLPLHLLKGFKVGLAFGLFSRAFQIVG